MPNAAPTTVCRKHFPAKIDSTFLQSILPTPEYFDMPCRINRKRPLLSPWSSLVHAFAMKSNATFSTVHRLRQQVALCVMDSMWVRCLPPCLVSAMHPWFSLVFFVSITIELERGETLFEGSRVQIVLLWFSYICVPPCTWVTALR